MKDSEFVHLHLHSEYSLLDGAIRIADLPRLAKEMGHEAVALTDHGNMFGAVAFYEACRKEGIHPVLGCEVYVAPTSRFVKSQTAEGSYFHLVLLVENETGYRNLIEMLSKSYIEGFYTKPRIDLELLQTHHEGLIALSACLGGYIPQAILRGDFAGARDYAKKLAEIFGEEHFYLELQDHGLREQKEVNAFLCRIAQELSLPLVATNDCHYAARRDSEAQAILLCIQTNTVITDGKPVGFETDEFYYKSTMEMEALFRDHPEALTNTKKIADRCRFDFTFDQLYLPVYHTPDGTAPAAYLRALAKQGFEKRIADGDLVPSDEHPLSEYEQRVEYELSVIERMGYVEYYLIVWDFVHYAKSVQIPTGPGRGSGAGSLVAFLIGITDVDSIRFGLMFERFLNPERVSMPDFDIDFCYERRGEVIAYVARKYGADHVAQIITFGTLAARAVVRDVGRALGMSYADTDAVAKRIPGGIGVMLKTIIDSGAFRDLVEANPDVQKLLDIALALEGMPRHASTHAAGVVITDRPVSSYVPLAENSGQPVTQFDMDTVAKLGLLKIDFLGLRYLTVISDAERQIRERIPDFDITKVPHNDPATYAMIGAGKTTGVFQLESGGMRQCLQNMKPDCMEDIVAAIALYRPGPMESIPQYLENRRAPEEIRYATPALEKILGVTYGCIVYQEQVMQIFREVAGYSLGRADIVRRAMSKKKADVMAKEKTVFLDGERAQDGTVTIPGAVALGTDRATAEELFERMAAFANYAFNKSHAAAYAHLSFRTAYLKCHFPGEYLSALLTSVLGNTAKTAEYTVEASHHGIRVMAPDVNESDEYFRMTQGKDGGYIRFGLVAVKGVGIGAARQIIEERRENGRFSSFEDFVERMASRDLSKRLAEALIRAGAMDSFGVRRSVLYATYEQIIDACLDRLRQNPAGQIDLFSAFSQETAIKPKKPTYEYPDLPEYTLRERLLMEREATGQYFSGHPLDEYRDHEATFSPTPIREILSAFAAADDAEAAETAEPAQSTEGQSAAFADKQTVTVAGAVAKRVNKQTRKGDPMAFVTLEDRFGEIELVVFPKILERYGASLHPDGAVAVRGELSVKDEEPPKILVSEIVPLLPNEQFAKTPEKPAFGAARIQNGASLRKNQTPPAPMKTATVGKVFLNLPSLTEDCREYARVLSLLEVFPGPVPVVLHDASSGKYLATGSGGIAYSDAVHDALVLILGAKNVVVK